MKTRVAEIFGLRARPGVQQLQFQVGLVWPRSVAAGIKHDLCEHRRISADVVWYDWSSAFGSLNMQFTNPSNGALPPVFTNSLPLDWRRFGFVQAGLRVRAGRCFDLPRGLRLSRQPGAELDVEPVPRRRAGACLLGGLLRRWHGMMPTPHTSSRLGPSGTLAQARSSAATSASAPAGRQRARSRTCTCPAGNGQGRVARPPGPGRAYRGHRAPVPRPRDDDGGGRLPLHRDCTGARSTATGGTPSTWRAELDNAITPGSSGGRSIARTPSALLLKGPVPQVWTRSRPRTRRASRSGSRRCGRRAPSCHAAEAHPFIKIGVPTVRRNPMVERLTPQSVRRKATRSSSSVTVSRSA